MGSISEESPIVETAANNPETLIQHNAVTTSHDVIINYIQDTMEKEFFEEDPVVETATNRETPVHHSAVTTSDNIIINDIRDSLDKSETTTEAIMVKNNAIPINIAQIDKESLDNYVSNNNPTTNTRSNIIVTEETKASSVTSDTKHFISKDQIHDPDYFFPDCLFETLETARMAKMYETVIGDPPLDLNEIDCMQSFTSQTKDTFQCLRIISVSENTDKIISLDDDDAINGNTAVISESHLEDMIAHQNFDDLINSNDDVQEQIILSKLDEIISLDDGNGIREINNISRKVNDQLIHPNAEETNVVNEDLKKIDDILNCYRNIEVETQCSENDIEKLIPQYHIGTESSCLNIFAADIPENMNKHRSVEKHNNMTDEMYCMQFLSSKTKDTIVSVAQNVDEIISLDDDDDINGDTTVINKSLSDIDITVQKMQNDIGIVLDLTQDENDTDAHIDQMIEKLINNDCSLIRLMNDAEKLTEGSQDSLLNVTNFQDVDNNVNTSVLEKSCSVKNTGSNNISYVAQDDGITRHDGEKNKEIDQTSDSECEGYHSSDFEFISESEAKKEGFVIKQFQVTEKSDPVNKKRLKKQKISGKTFCTDAQIRSNHSKSLGKRPASINSGNASKKCLKSKKNASTNDPVTKNRELYPRNSLITTALPSFNTSFRFQSFLNLNKIAENNDSVRTNYELRHQKRVAYNELSGNNDFEPRKEPYISFENLTNSTSVIDISNSARKGANYNLQNDFYSSMVPHATSTASEKVINSAVLVDKNFDSSANTTPQLFDKNHYRDSSVVVDKNKDSMTTSTAPPFDEHYHKDMTTVVEKNTDSSANSIAQSSGKDYRRDLATVVEKNMDSSANSTAQPFGKDYHRDLYSVVDSCATAQSVLYCRDTNTAVVDKNIDLPTASASQPFGNGYYIDTTTAVVSKKINSPASAAAQAFDKDYSKTLDSPLDKDCGDLTTVVDKKVDSSTNSPAQYFSRDYYRNLRAQYETAERRRTRMEHVIPEVQDLYDLLMMSRATGIGGASKTSRLHGFMDINQQWNRPLVHEDVSPQERQGGEESRQKILEMYPDDNRWRRRSLRRRR